jgi:peptidoglycan hydrolase CwlO-like protein
MSKNIKITISVLVLIIAVLLVIVFFRKQPATPVNNNSKIEQLESSIKQVYTEIGSLKDSVTITNLQQRALKSEISIVDSHIAEIAKNKKNLELSFIKDKSKLKNASLEELKQIALKN